jgi:hypothetical protein
MRVVPLVVRLICKRPLDRAIILFAARGLARNRQHRLLVAAYGGIALAISLAYAKSLLYGNSRQRWDEPNVALLVAGFVLTIFGVIGVRAVFALPIALAGNWIFRTTTLTAPAAYFNAVRKSVYALTAVPIGIGLAIFYLAVWPWRPALYHMTVLLLVTTIVIERSMYGFSKIPFACSYSPGKANLNVRLGAYAVLFLSASDLGVRMELLAIQQPHRLIILLAVLLGAALWSRHRATKLATAPDSHILFEDVPLPILTLDTRRDGAWMGDEAYAGSIDPKIAGAS